MTKNNLRISFLLLAVALGLTLSTGSVLAQEAVSYVRTSHGLVATFALDTQPETVLYAISYADEPSIVDTSYVFVRENTVVAALMPGQIWIKDRTGAMKPYASASIPVGLLPDRVRTDAMVGQMFASTSFANSIVDAKTTPSIDVQAEQNQLQSENPMQSNQLEDSRVGGAEPFDWKAYADEYNN